MGFLKTRQLRRDEIALLNRARAMVAAQRALRKLRGRNGITEERMRRAEDRASEAAMRFDEQVLAMASDG